MDQAQYVQRIDWARKGVVAYLIFFGVSVVIGFVQGFMQGFSGVAQSSSSSISLLTFILQLLIAVAAFAYFAGFWTMAAKYRQKSVKVGSGILLVVIIVTVFAQAVLMVMESAPPAATVGASLGFLAGVFGALWVMAAGYIALGVGLKKLEAAAGSRARSIGNLFFWSGIAAATIIGAPVALVLWFIAYIMSYRLFSEELARARA